MAGSSAKLISTTRNEVDSSAKLWKANLV